MLCINDILNTPSEDSIQHNRLALCAHLEVDLGHYAVRTYSTQHFEMIYYDEGEVFPTTFPKETEKIVACVFGKENYAFVRCAMYEKFKEDTQGYGLTLIPVDSFEEKLLYCDTSKPIPSFLDGIQWYDDDFLHDDSLPFDNDSFEAIDIGVSYLNPRHFSVVELSTMIANQALKG